MAGFVFTPTANYLCILRCSHYFISSKRIKTQTENKLKKAISPSETVLISHEHARIMQRATYAAVPVAVILVVIKLGAYLVTDSVAMLSALIDSALDVAASLINLFTVRNRTDIS